MLNKIALSLQTYRNIYKQLIARAAKEGRALTAKERNLLSFTSAHLMNTDVGKGLGTSLTNPHILDQYAQGQSKHFEKAFAKALSGKTPSKELASKLTPEESKVIKDILKNPDRELKMLPEEQRWKIEHKQQRNRDLEDRLKEKGVRTWKELSAADRANPLYTPYKKTRMSHVSDPNLSLGVDTGGTGTSVIESMERGRTIPSKASIKKVDPAVVAIEDDARKNIASLFTRFNPVMRGMQERSKQELSDVANIVSGKGLRPVWVDQVADNSDGNPILIALHKILSGQTSKTMHQASKDFRTATGEMLEMIPSESAKDQTSTRAYEHIKSLLKFRQKQGDTDKLIINNLYDFHHPLPGDRYSNLYDVLKGHAHDIQLSGNRSAAGIIPHPYGRPPNWRDKDVDKLGESLWMDHYAPGLLGKSVGSIYDPATKTHYLTAEDLATVQRLHKNTVVKDIQGAMNMFKPESVAGMKLQVMPDSMRQMPYTHILQEPIETATPRHDISRKLDEMRASYQKIKNLRSDPEAKPQHWYRPVVLGGKARTVTNVFDMPPVPSMRRMITGAEESPAAAKVKEEIQKAVDELPIAQKLLPMGHDAVLTPSGKVRAFETNVSGWSARDLYEYISRGDDKLNVFRSLLARNPVWGAETKAALAEKAKKAAIVSALIGTGIVGGTVAGKKIKDSVDAA